MAACKKSLEYESGQIAWKVYRAQAEAYILKKDIDSARSSLDLVLQYQGGTDKRTTQL